MTPEFLAFANAWLLTRFVCLFRDDATSAKVWRIKAGVELIVFGLLYSCGLAWYGALATVVALNFAGFTLERRARRKDFARLVLGLAGVAAWSIWLSPRLGLGFRPEWGEWGARLGHWTALTPFLQTLVSGKFQLVLFGLLVSANESNLVIRAVFDWLDLKPRALPTGSDNTIDVREFNRGRVIGVLERVLLYSFVLQAQYGAIGFILAAKAFTRFKALDDRPFAEYVLIGTLLSACLALATGGMVHWMLAH